MSKIETLPDVNADPITGEPGSHPVGTGVGAAGGAAAGVAVLSERWAQPSVRWRAELRARRRRDGESDRRKRLLRVSRNRPYYRADRPYSDIEDAYRYGWESRARYGTKSWNEVESDLGRGWEKAKGKSSLAWNQAKDATRDAWHRVERAIPGDADRDGRWLQSADRE
jgi:hypothetical protein